MFSEGCTNTKGDSNHLQLLFESEKGYFLCEWKGVCKDNLDLIFIPPFLLGIQGNIFPTLSMQQFHKICQTETDPRSLRYFFPKRQAYVISLLLLPLLLYNNSQSFHIAGFPSFLALHHRQHFLQMHHQIHCQFNFFLKFSLSWLRYAFFLIYLHNERSTDTSVTESWQVKITHDR